MEIAVKVAKRPVIWQGKKRFPGETLIMALGQAESLSRQYPGALEWVNPLAKAEPELQISPAALKLADEHGIDPEQIEGSGKDGLIVKADVQRAIAASAEAEPDTEPEPEAGEAEDEHQPG